MPNENIKKAVAQRLNDDRSQCEEMLGDEVDVSRIAAMWRANKLSLKLVEAGLLLDFCRDKSFTKEEYDAYRLGVEAWCKLFEECDIEVSTRQELVEEAKKAKELEGLDSSLDSGIM